MEPERYNNGYNTNDRSVGGYGTMGGQGVQSVNGVYSVAGNPQGNNGGSSGGDALQGVNAKPNHGTIIIMVILAALAVGGMIFGASMLITKNVEVAELSRQMARSGAVEGEVLLVNSSEGNTKDYIYIGEWGIKIKIVDGLKYLRYDYRTFTDRSALGVSGASGEAASEPNFVNAAAELGGIGRVVRVVNGYGYGYGKLVFTSGGYDYYYEPLTYTDFVEPSEVELENGVARLIEEMLTNADNYSLIAL